MKLSRSRAKLAAMACPAPRGRHLLCFRCDSFADASGSCAECGQSDMVAHCHRAVCSKCRKERAA